MVFVDGRVETPRIYWQNVAAKLYVPARCVLGTKKRPRVHTPPQKKNDDTFCNMESPFQITLSYHTLPKSLFRCDKTSMVKDSPGSLQNPTQWRFFTRVTWGSTIKSISLPLRLCKRWLITTTYHLPTEIYFTPIVFRNPEHQLVGGRNPIRIT